MRLHCISHCCQDLFAYDKEQKVQETQSRFKCHLIGNGNSYDRLKVCWYVPDRGYPNNKIHYLINNGAFFSGRTFPKKLFLLCSLALVCFSLFVCPMLHLCLPGNIQIMSYTIGSRMVPSTLSTSLCSFAPVCCSLSVLSSTIPPWSVF